MRETTSDKNERPKVPDFETLRFPAEISDIIGLSANEINFLKKKGCPFYGRKTSVKWVRKFLAKVAGALPEPLQRAHRRRSDGNKCDEPSLSSGSRVASLAPRTGLRGGSGK